MENANIIAKKNQIKFSELFSVSYLKPLGISLGLMFIQQFSGINAVMFYSVSIFKVSSFVMYISSVSKFHILVKTVVDSLGSESLFNSGICENISGTD